VGEPSEEKVGNTKLIAGGGVDDPSMVRLVLRLSSLSGPLVELRGEVLGTR